MARSPVVALRGLVEQLERSQWASPEALAAFQLQHVERLAVHARAHSRMFARRLSQAGLTAADLGTPDGFARLPVMTRRDVQTAGDDLHCDWVPESHGPVTHTATSGSTGEPVVVRRTLVSALFAQAMIMRDLRWHERDLSGRLCLVRAHIPRYARHDDWGAPANLFARTGPLLMLPIATDVPQLATWIREFRPTLLVIYPGTLRAFTAHCRDCGIDLPGLTQILTVGETLSAAVRSDAAATFGASVTDCYSSEEFGAIAIECPESGLYHVMAEGLLVEVLDDRGTGCRPGEVGRVVVTDLHNYATPLVRYDIGDYAEVARPCPCGRGLPAWRRIAGRERNLIVMPDGRRHWPLTGFPRVRDLVPVAQFQFVQESREEIELRLVVDRTLTRDEEARLKTLFCETAGHPFAIRITYFKERLPCGPSGKFEEFVCCVAAN
ncbi:MAG TPA: AMP-binding protein [Vicinamibacterales bacterium]|nr:AMP-binding protein [Vicinamibacterales bacterium]